MLGERGREAQALDLMQFSQVENSKMEYESRTNKRRDFSKWHRGIAISQHYPNFGPQSGRYAVERHVGQQTLMSSSLAAAVQDENDLKSIRYMKRRTRKPEFFLPDLYQLPAVQLAMQHPFDQRIQSCLEDSPVANMIGTLFKTEAS
ncbi:hypothetical protein E5288_WYG017925 [Bos mutus]|uniref:Uncharacterized protein n=1 Tax=Bos mutus TaxID=72004 RepID=A0A6B0RV50_9CETA|nr:hypothetical protein [Bos mutus]